MVKTSPFQWLRPPIIGDQMVTLNHLVAFCFTCCFINNWVVVSNIFYFHPYLGKIPILTNIFQRG